MRIDTLTESERDDLVIALADVQHEIWAHWMRYMFTQGKTDFITGDWTMPVAKADRWKRQMDTPYADLTSQERKSDIEQAEKVIAVLREWQQDYWGDALQSHNEALDTIGVLRGEIAQLRGMDICQDCGGDGGMGVLCATCSNSGYVARKVQP
ncbi:MAG: hypothetical protein IPM06_22600 [Rhizobiales bacterium]|nr:hypothetical protein [Hyphomicrobiales bacterium]